MKTTRKKQAARQTTIPDNESLATLLTSINQELFAIKAALLKSPNCRRTKDADCRSAGEARYLSKPEAANYQLLSPMLADSQDTIRFCKQHFQWLSERALQEEIHVLTLNGKHRVIRSHQVTVGLLNTTQVHPREVFRPAILDAAAGIILVHNHPSGDCEPSKEDLAVTESVEQAGKLIGIRLLDHIVVARGGATSIIESRNQNSRSLID